MRGKFQFVSGDSSEQSIANHSSRPTVLQLNCVSDTILNVFENRRGNFRKKLWCCVGGSVTRQFGFMNLVDNVNWPPLRDSVADVSSVSPSSG